MAFEPVDAFPWWQTM